MSEFEKDSAWTHIASRRDRERAGAGVVATLTHQRHLIEGILVDIARGGGRFKTADLGVELAEGLWVTVRFRCYRHATPEQIEAIAQVVWRKDYHDGARHVRAFGLEFGEPIDLRRVDFTR